MKITNNFCSNNEQQLLQESLSEWRERCKQELEELRKHHQTEKEQLLLQQQVEEKQKRENREKEQAENERALALLSE